MGGLWTRLTTTRWLFLTGSLALAGLMPLSGFFSKDEIIAAGFMQGPAHPLGGVVLVGVAALTAYYTIRAFLVTFMGAPQDAERQVQEARPGMLIPIVVLAVLAAFGGLIQPGFWHLLSDYLGSVLGPTTEGGVGLVLLTAGVSTVAVLGGMFVAYGLYSTSPQARASYPVNPVLEQAFFWDRLYAVAVVNPLWALGGALDRLVESPVIIGVADVAARAALLAGEQVRRVQSGYLRSYAMLFAAAALLVVVVAAMGVR